METSKLLKVDAQSGYYSKFEPFAHLGKLSLMQDLRLLLISLFTNALKLLNAEVGIWHFML